VTSTATELNSSKLGAGLENRYCGKPIRSTTQLEVQFLFFCELQVVDVILNVFVKNMYAECTGISTFSARPVRPGTRLTRKRYKLHLNTVAETIMCCPDAPPPPPPKKRGRGGVLLSQRIPEARFSIFTAFPATPESAEGGGRTVRHVRSRLHTITLVILRHTDRNTNQHCMTHGPANGPTPDATLRHRALP
jgi:hypothetical protein